MLSFQYESLGTFRLSGFGFGVGFFGAVANKEDHFILNNYGDVKSGTGFWSGPELGLGQVPKDLGVGVELLGPMLFPEDERFEVEKERELRWKRRIRRVKRVVMVVEEIEVKRVTEEGARPSEGEETEGSVVETGSEVRLFGGDRWRVLQIVLING